MESPLRTTMRIDMQSNGQSSPFLRTSIAPNDVLFIKETDAAFRSKRRSDIHEKRKSILTQSMIENNVNDRRSSEQGRIDERKSKEHLTLCSKLYNENKITVKNVWSLEVIDILKDISSKAGTNPLMDACKVLDIGGKVYGIRVDDVHNSTLKIASIISKGNNTTNLDEQDQENNESLNESSTVKTRPKRKSKKVLGSKENTVANDDALIDGLIEKIVPVGDGPSVDKNSTSIGGLFTKSLRMDCSTGEFIVFNKSTYSWLKPDEDVNENANALNTESFEVILEEDPPENLKFYPTLDNFTLNQWDPEQEKEELALEKSLIRMTDVVMDSDGIPFHELDGSIHGIVDFNPDPTDSDDHRDVEENDDNHFETMHGQQFLTNNTIAELQFVPFYWKMKGAVRRPARFCGRLSEIVVKRQGRKRNVINFEPFEFEENNDYEDNIKKFKLRKRTSQDPKIIQCYMNESPFNFEQAKKNLNKLISTKHNENVVYYKDMKNRTQKDVIGVENHDNHCARNLESPDLFADDYQHNDMSDFPDQGDHGTFTEEIRVNQQKAYESENLVEAPEMIQDNYKPAYALTSKKINMKKLKAIVWNNYKNDTNPEKNFSDLYEKCYQQAPLKVREEISKAITFVAVLHLSNENGLQLSPKSKKDFVIKLPSQYKEKL